MGLVAVTETAARLPVRTFGACLILFGGYLYGAAADPRRRWPAPAISLALKIAVPALVLAAYSAGEISGDSLWLLVPLYAVWWIPLGAVARRTLADGLAGTDQASHHVAPLTSVIATISAQDGRSLEALTQDRPQLVVFLRHFGCTFCREALTDIVDRRHDIEALGLGIVLVHMSDDDEAAAFLSHYGLEDVPRISDPKQHLYRAADLHRGSALQLMGPKVWWRALSGGLVRKHGIGRVLGDGFQMPGAFVVYHGELLYSFRHRTAADRPDYLDLARCGLAQGSSA